MRKLESEYIMSIVLDKKKISISPKGQMTMPKKYYIKYNFNNSADIIDMGDGLFIRPTSEDMGEVDEEILADLISQGLNGNELLVEFRNQRKKIRPAVEKMLNIVDESIKNKEYVSFDEVFKD